MFEEVLSTSSRLLHSWRIGRYEFLQTRRLVFEFPHRVETVVCRNRQGVDRDDISVVKPKQNRAFKLRDCRRFFVYALQTQAFADLVVAFCHWSVPEVI